MTVISALKIITSMSAKNKNVLVYVVLLLGKSYRVKVGHLDEFVSLFLDKLSDDDIVITGTVWDSLSNYSQAYEWYRKV